MPSDCSKAGKTDKCYAFFVHKLNTAAKCLSNKFAVMLYLPLRLSSLMLNYRTITSLRRHDKKLEWEFLLLILFKSRDFRLKFITVEYSMVLVYNT